MKGIYGEELILADKLGWIDNSIQIKQISPSKKVIFNPSPLHL
jgi:hypothetical protein